MPAAQIFRPACDANFTILPNELFNFGHFYPDLKPRDTAVLTYLFSKFDYATSGKLWNINHNAIANALNIGVWSVGQALKKLQKLGFASYQRFANGTTEWIIKFPEKIATTRATPPHDEKPNVGKPHWENPPALITTSLLENTSTTTNVVVEEVKELPIPASFTESEVKTAKRELAKLPSYELQIAVLAQIAQVMLAKKAKKPLKYLLGLINLALKGEFEMPPTSENIEALKQAKKNDSERVIQGIVNRNKEKIMTDLEVKGFVHFHGFGNFTRDMLKPYLR